MKNNKRNYIIILLLTAIILYLVFKDNFTEKIKYLFSFDIKWLLFAFILMISYWVLKGIVLYYCVKKIDKTYTRKKGINLMLTTQFFHAITPFSTGGQPWQIYKLKKEGLTLGESTTIIVEDFIVYQIALVSLGLIAVVVNNTFNILSKDSFLKYLVTIGFIINALIIVLLFLVAFNKKWNKKIINGTINFGAKIKVIKDKESLLKKAENFINNFHKSADILFKHKLNFIKIILLNFFALSLLYLIPYALMRGLNINANPFIVVITSAYVMLIGGVVPVPGAAGGLEYSFMSFFKNFIKGPKLSIIMIVWRIITYYFGLIIGLFILSFCEEDNKWE